MTSENKVIQSLRNVIKASESRLDALYKNYAPEIETEPLFRETQYFKGRLNALETKLEVKKNFAREFLETAKQVQGGANAKN